MGTPVGFSEHGIVGARDGDGSGERFRAAEPLWQGHMGARRLYENLPREQWDGYRKFATVRNPFDRALSRFFYRHRISGGQPFGNFDAARAAFAAYLLDDPPPNDRYVVHLSGICVLDDVIRFERIEDDVQRIAGRLNLGQIMGALPHARANPGVRFGRSVADFFCKATVDAVRRADDWMFALGHYSTDPRDA